MAEELIGNLDYESPQSDTKRQKLLECILTRNDKLYLGSVYTEDQLAKLNRLKANFDWTGVGFSVSFRDINGFESPDFD